MIQPIPQPQRQPQSGIHAQPQFSIYTLSLGKHVPLLTRLRAAAAAGYTQIELDTNDWQTYCESYCAAHSLSPSCLQAQTKAAQSLHRELTSLNLSVLCLQPFRHFEGLYDPEKKASMFAEAISLFHAMRNLQTDLLLIPSSFLSASSITNDRDTLASDIRALADAARFIDPKLRIAYEALAWGTYVDTWQDAWDIIQRVDRSNVGLVLDSFNWLGRTYADPTIPGGKRPDAELSYLSSLAHLVHTVPASRIFLLQIADGALLPSPLDLKTLGPDVPPRLFWSRTSRVFPGEFERGAYLPVHVFMRAVVKQMGFKGSWSLEYFNSDLERKEDQEGVAAELADRGMKSLEWLYEQVEGDGYSSGEDKGY